MTAVSMFEAKTNLSKYVSSLTDKEEQEIIILRNGKPVAKLIPFQDTTHQRIGIGKGYLPTMGSLEDFNAIVSENDLLAGGDVV